MRFVTRSLMSAALAAAPLAAGAQGLSDMSLATIPQFVSLKIGSDASAKTVSQFTVPFLAVVPFGSRFNIDVATAFATSDVSVDGKSQSTISGLTDTQVRANITLFDNAMVMTVGANLPTGKYQIEEDKSEAAGQIGNDFLIFPTSSYGSGQSFTGGLAFARNLGSWNVGVAGSFRKSNEFDAYTTAADTGKATLTFQPADEVRARVGVDRSIGSGRLALGVTYSSFGEDRMLNTSYATGDRFIGQASLYFPVGTTDLYLSGWGLYRAKGEQFGGVSNPETVANGAVSLGFHLGSLLVEPSVEGRSWAVDGVKAGLLGNGGLRLRFGVGAVTVIPTATYQVGNLYDTADGTSIKVSGWRAGLTFRVH